MQKEEKDTQRDRERERDAGRQARGQADRDTLQRLRMCDLVCKKKTDRERRDMKADMHVGRQTETDYKDRGCAIWFARERDRHTERQGEKGMQVDRHVGRQAETEAMRFGLQEKETDEGEA